MNYQAWSASLVMGALKALHDAGAFSGNVKDARIMLDLAKFSEERRFLTPRQQSFVKGLLPKYGHILKNLDIPKIQPARKEDKEYGICTFSIFNPKTIKIEADAGNPLLRMAKRIAGFREQESGVYHVPFSPRNAYVLSNAGFVMGKRVREILERALERDVGTLPMPDFSSIKMPLKEYQKRGIASLLEKETGALLADEQGLGKTAQAISWAELAGISKVCIVCPASLKANWRREIKLWTGQEDCVILSGKTPTNEQKQAIADSRWLIINYDILSEWVPVLSRVGIQAFIFDEAQALKNDKRKRTKAALELSRGHRILLLSGTPCENRPADLFPLIRMVDPLLFPSRMKFYERFCDLHLNAYGYNDYSGASNTQELHKILTDTVMIRRKKEDVLQELPDKQRAIIPVSILAADKREYRKANDDFVSWLSDNKPDKGGEWEKQKLAQAMIKVGVLKRLAATAKIPMVIDWIKTYLENERKLVVFAIHRDVIKALAAEFGDMAVVVDGSVPAEKRQDLCDAFQNDDKVRLFIGNIKAAGTGLTLTAAKDTLTVEFAWTSTAHDQCEDRVHRIGQKNAVTAYYILAEDTVEEKIVTLIEDKRAVVSQILDGHDPVDTNMLEQLLKSYEAS